MLVNVWWGLATAFSNLLHLLMVCNYKNKKRLIFLSVYPLLLPAPCLTRCILLLCLLCASHVEKFWSSCLCVAIFSGPSNRNFLPWRPIWASGITWMPALGSSQPFPREFCIHLRKCFPEIFNAPPSIYNLDFSAIICVHSNMHLLFLGSAEIGALSIEGGFHGCRLLWRWSGKITKHQAPQNIVWTQEAFALIFGDQAKRRGHLFPSKC